MTKTSSFRQQIGPFGMKTWRDNFVLRQTSFFAPQSTWDRATGGRSWVLADLDADDDNDLLILSEGA